MQVAKWGNSLAVRIPSAVADALGLREGDDIAIRIAGDRSFEIERNDTRSTALAKIRSLKIKLPEGWKFGRDEANQR
jgi:antitoxin MazE